ncbi:MAG: DNA-binding response regulator [Sphingomonadaceae bacterium]|nr:DNA-binding response regulator [Sphingomonadaceae bacterium]NCA02389.1 DNA-binding response regulator [Sphingomonadaceae bacterium]
MLRFDGLAEMAAELSFAGSLPEALGMMARQQFDLVLLDYSMPGMDGYAGLSRAVQHAAGVPVVLMSGTAPTDAAFAVLDRGGAGFIPKTMPARSFVNAVRFMAAGEKYLPPHGLKAAIDGDVGTGPLAALTERERHILKGLCDSLSNKEIARRLAISEPTVKVHAQSVYRKLGARNRTHAAIIAREHGFG